jgi:hypothetical protein
MLGNDVLVEFIRSADFTAWELPYRSSGPAQRPA